MRNDIAPNANSNQDNREEVSENQDNREEVSENQENLKLKLKAQRIMRQKGAEASALSNISVRRAIKHDPKRAGDAIHKELEQMLKGKKVFAPVMRRDVKGQVIRSHMFLKYKYDAQGRLEKLKARLVADGRSQDRELYRDNYSPTVSLESIMSTLKLAAISRKSLAKFDIKGAYLNADLDEELYLELDPTITRLAVARFPELADFVEAGRLTVRLDKALYGLVQCARLWFENISSFLISIGFTQNPFDECVFTNKKGLIVILYVDDLLVSCASLKEIHWLELKLKSKYDEVDSVYGKKFTYLGVLLEQQEDGSIHLSMPQYIEDITRSEFGAREYSTPADQHLFDEDPSAQPLDEAGARVFHSMVMKLMYMCMRVRGDALLPVLYLSTKVKSPTTSDENKLKRVVGYLKRTRDRCKVISATEIERVEMFIDASFSSHPDGAGHSALVAFVGTTATILKSSKQKIGTKNSTEAELVALSDLYLVGIWLHEFLGSLGVSLKTPIIYQDNKSTMALVQSLLNSKPRSRHLNARRRVMYDEIMINKSVDLAYLQTNEMVADVLSKPLCGEKFFKFAARLQGTKN